MHAAKRRRGIVKAIVLLAPATKENTGASAYRLRYKLPLNELVEKSSRLVKQGNGEQVIEGIGLMTCNNTKVSANSFLSYYGSDAEVDTPSLIIHSAVPVFVVVAGADSVVVGLDKKIQHMVDGNRIQMRRVEGSGHMFRDLFADEAIEGVSWFIGRVVK